MAEASRAIVRAGVVVDMVDVGGGFPAIYPGMDPARDGRLHARNRARPSRR